MGISTRDSGISLLGDKIFIVDDGTRYRAREIGASPRIGVDYACEDALLPYRFYVRGNPFVSGRVKN